MKEYAMKKTKLLLTQLLDREAIRDLPLRYCDCVWRGDIEGLVDLFSKDGAFVIKAPDGETAAKGRAALHQFYVDGLKHLPRPYIHNHVLELQGEKRATGRCYLDLRSAKNNMDWLGAGHYVDDYVKVRGKWKFASRYFTAVRMEEGPGSAGAAALAPDPATKTVRPATRKKKTKA